MAKGPEDLDFPLKPPLRKRIVISPIVKRRVPEFLDRAKADIIPPAQMDGTVRTFAELPNLSVATRIEWIVAYNHATGSVRRHR
jgi:hypothetical protein